MICKLAKQKNLKVISMILILSIIGITQNVYSLFIDIEEIETNLEISTGSVDTEISQIKQGESLGINKTSTSIFTIKNTGSIKQKLDVNIGEDILKYKEHIDVRCSISKNNDEYMDVTDKLGMDSMKLSYMDIDNLILESKDYISLKIDLILKSNIEVNSVDMGVYISSSQINYDENGNMVYENIDFRDNQKIVSSIGVNKELISMRNINVKYSMYDKSNLEFSFTEEDSKKSAELVDGQAEGVDIDGANDFDFRITRCEYDDELVCRVKFIFGRDDGMKYKAFWDICVVDVDGVLSARYEVVE